MRISDWSSDVCSSDLIQGAIKDAKLKVDSQINGDKLRVTGKKRDDLQAVMALLRGKEFELPLQFDNFRDYCCLCRSGLSRELFLAGADKLAAKSAPTGNTRTRATEMDYATEIGRAQAGNPVNNAQLESRIMLKK